MKRFFLLACLAAMSALAHSASAVGASFWKQTSEADFKAGSLENVVATNLGDLKLSRAVKTLLEQDPKISSVNALAEAADGSLLAGTGPHGMILQIKDEKVSTIATIADGAAVLSLLVEKDGAIIAGTGGASGRVLRFDKPNADPKPLLEEDGVQYIWALAQTPDGNIYAATGPKGALYEIKPDGSHRAIVETGESNLLSMISDGKDLLYVGTDPHGLIYRVNRKTGDSFVLYNAAESEVSALVLDKNGNLYAGTSEAKQDNGGAADEAAAAPDKSGRPEGGAVGVPIPRRSPKRADASASAQSQSGPARPDSQDPGGSVEPSGSSMAHRRSFAAGDASAGGADVFSRGAGDVRR